MKLINNKWVFVERFASYHGDRYQFRSKEIVAPGHYNWCDMSVEFFWTGKHGIIPDYGEADDEWLDEYFGYA